MRKLLVGKPVKRQSPRHGDGTLRFSRSATPPCKLVGRRGHPTEFPMIVVTAPTSNIGHQVLANILDKGEPIRAIARNPSRLPAPTRERVTQQPRCRQPSVYRRRRSVLAGTPEPCHSKPRGGLSGLHPVGLRGNREPWSPTRGWNLSPRPRDSGRGQRRAGHGIAGDGRPDSQHGRELPGALDALIHGQRLGPGRPEQEPGCILLSH
jgi:hypothetical protein